MYKKAFQADQENSAPRGVPRRVLNISAIFFRMALSRDFQITLKKQHHQPTQPHWNAVCRCFRDRIKPLFTQMLDFARKTHFTLFCYLFWVSHNRFCFRQGFRPKGKYVVWSITNECGCILSSPGKLSASWRVVKSVWEIVTGSCLTKVFGELIDMASVYTPGDLDPAVYRFRGHFAAKLDSVGTHLHKKPAHISVSPIHCDCQPLVSHCRWRFPGAPCHCYSLSPTVSCQLSLS